MGRPNVFTDNEESEIIEAINWLWDSEVTKIFC